MNDRLRQRKGRRVRPAERGSQQVGPFGRGMILPNLPLQQAGDGPRGLPSSPAAVRNIARKPGNGLLVDAASHLAEARRGLSAVEQLLEYLQWRRPLVLRSWE